MAKCLGKMALCFRQAANVLRPVRSSRATFDHPRTRRKIRKSSEQMALCHVSPLPKFMPRSDPRKNGTQHIDRLVRRQQAGNTGEYRPSSQKRSPIMRRRRAAHRATYCGAPGPFIYLREAIAMTLTRNVSEGLVAVSPSLTRRLTLSQPLRFEKLKGPIAGRPTAGLVVLPLVRRSAR